MVVVRGGGMGHSGGVRVGEGGRGHMDIHCRHFFAHLLTLRMLRVYFVPIIHIEERE